MRGDELAKVGAILFSEKEEDCFEAERKGGRSGGRGKESIGQTERIVMTELKTSSFETQISSSVARVNDASTGVLSLTLYLGVPVQS